MIKYLLLLIVPIASFAQSKGLHELLYNSYDDYKETSIENRRFKHNEIQPLIDSLKNTKGFDF